MVSLKQLNNGIVELASAAIILGALPMANENGGVTFCFVPKYSLSGLGLSKEKQKQLEEEVIEFNSFAFDENMNENELGCLFDKFAKKFVTICHQEKRPGEPYVDLKQYPRQNETIKHRLGYDFTNAAYAVISRTDNFEQRKGLIEASMKQLDGLCDSWKISGDEFRATMRKVVYRVLEALNTPQDGKQKSE